MDPPERCGPSTLDLTDAHRLGIPEIDEEHRTFFALVRALEASLAGGDGRATRAALADLRRYAAAHFANEEAFLDAAGYPELARHRAEHAEFMRDVDLLEQAPGLPGRVAVRMARAWLGQHILGTDRRYSAWLDAADGAPPDVTPAPARR